MGGIVFGEVIGYLLDHGFSYVAVFNIAGTLHIGAFLIVLAAIPVLLPLSLERKLSSEAAHDAGVTLDTGRGLAPWLLIAATVLMTPPVLRIFGVVHWAWALVLAPFTAMGAACAIGLTAVFYRERLAALRTRVFGARAADESTTPPPDRLEPPQAAADTSDAILAEHPEILAALCHGFRMKKLVPSILGRPVADPWGSRSGSRSPAPSTWWCRRRASATARGA